MRAGRLRHRITLQRQVRGKDAAGNPVTSWEAFAADVPAEVVPLSGRDLIAAQAAQSEITDRCTIRWMPGVLASMRVLYQGDVYAIQGPPLADPRGRRHLTLMLAGGLTDGR